MPLSAPKLALPDSEETIAFRCIDSILRSDPDVKRAIKTFVSWKGETLDGEEPTASMCPYLMLVPSGRPSAWATEGQHQSPLQVGVMLAVVGSDADQLMNLWGLIRSTLFPQDEARRTAILTRINAAKITNGEITSPAYSIKANDDDDQIIMAAAGTLELYLLINT